MKSLMKGAFASTFLLLCSLCPLACESRRLVVGAILGESAECTADGSECEGASDCCSRICQGNVCATRHPTCGSAGEQCFGPRDCCSSHCAFGQCEDSCRIDGQDCTQPEDCCSGYCQEGTCASPSDECASSGNLCDTDEECCSQLCLGGRCDLGSSFCTQANDICLVDAECCSGACVFETESYLGRCDGAPTGPANCKDGIAGTVCGSCNDCCSRLCVPFGSLGTFVCQQAQGCRQTGELCSQDQECCGGDPESGLPGAGNVTCEKRDEADGFGICRNAMSCSPQGNACHFKNYVCSVSAASNRCCASDGTGGECVLDGQGVPRCNGMGDVCLDSGMLCAQDGDCCQGRCLPDEGSLLRCAAGPSCQLEGRACSTSSDCCPETLCRRLSDSSFGVCSMSGAPTCSLIGQLCGVLYPECCGEAVCSEGLCVGANEVVQP